MTYLIDGYNLLHAVGWATKRMPGRRLEAARRRLLDWLATVAGSKSGATFRVVFDSQQGPAESSEMSHKGVLVRFAHRRTADDVIEELLAAEANPRTVTVVSNDTRLHEAARRAGSAALGSREFLDWVIATERSGPEEMAAAPEKPEGPANADEVTDLLRAFGEPKP